MQFKHLVEINDPLNPLIEPLTREQLWRGLVLRAEDPVPFVVGLDQCTVVERFHGGLRRELRFGHVIVRDCVTFEPEAQRIRYDTQAEPDMPAAHLTVTIEEPSEGALWVRFEYDSGSTALPLSMDAVYDDFRRSAYKEADIDTISRIRQLAVEGRLDARLN